MSVHSASKIDNDLPNHNRICKYRIFHCPRLQSLNTCELTSKRSTSPGLQGFWPTLKIAVVNPFTGRHVVGPDIIHDIWKR